MIGRWEIWEEPVSFMILKLFPWFWTAYLQTLFYDFLMFIYLERERESVIGEGQREGERENPKQALHYEHRAWPGAPSQEP